MDGQMYDLFVQEVINTETPSLDTIQRARQQFLEECDENELQEQLIQCLKPFLGEVKEEHVNWWGLIMCSLFEIHIAGLQLGVCEDD